MIAVENGVNDRVYPQNADFTFYGGLYRDVNIIAVNKSHFDLDYYGGPGIKVTPEIKGADASVEVEVFLTNAAADQKLVYTVKDAEGKKRLQRQRPQPARQRLYFPFRQFICGTERKIRICTPQRWRLYPERRPLMR